jgi:hypothetical protein
MRATHTISLNLDAPARPGFPRAAVALGLLGLLLAWTAPALGADCNGNALDDECDLDCSAQGGACNVAGCGQSADCDANGVPDECDVANHGTGCSFPLALLDNATGGPDASFLGAPDDVYWGIGGQILTYQFDCGFVVDGPGPDFTLYEVDTGSAEFNNLEDVLVSVDGVNFVSVKATEGPAINIPGDETHGSNGFARSYDLSATGFPVALYIRLDGAGSGAGGTSSGFDLDAVGAIHRLGLDCDGSGTLDVCEGLQDCNGNGAPESCELAAGLVADCNSNGTPDTCDTLGGVDDCDLDTIPDSCEPDCNANTTPDDCDIASATSDDCNANAVPDECDLAATMVVESSGAMTPFGNGYARSLTIPAAFPSSGDVTVSVTTLGDFGASNEYVDVDVNATGLGRLFDTAGGQCAETTEPLVVAADDFNSAVAGGDAVFSFVTPSAANALDCGGATYVAVVVDYAPIVDCNTNGTLDACDISGATSTDLNSNGIADDCEPDCNTNAVPDDWDISQGTSEDCNANEIPDECDVDAGGASLDCNANLVPDECEIDCNTNGVPDDCDIASATSQDCDSNAVPDECDLAIGTGGCSFPQTLLDNSTGGPDENFLGPPDDVFWGLGGQVVTYELDCGFIVNGDGPDFSIYEVDSGGVEFDSLADVLVSADGVTFVSVKSSESPVVRIPGDDVHGNDSFARSYDLEAAPLNAVRFVRLDGAGSGAGGTSTGFDLDAIGAVHRLGVDCDSSGTLDRCESFSDCNTNALNDACEIAAGLDDDCNMNSTLDFCDVASGAADVDDDRVPDECEPDCNTNSVPDDYDIEQGTSSDCNDNTIPDDCDIDSATSQDCNNDLIPDECPLCPTVEVTFIMDTSSSMSDEGSALCGTLSQVVADLQSDLVDADVELLGILSTGGSTFSCLTDTVGNLYGTAVPGSPPAGMETLGEPCGANLNEDWGPATAIVAGLKPWQADSVRLIVPISDEGPRCGDPVNDPGDDRDSVNLAIGQAQINDVILSPITGTGSSAGVVAMADLMAANTDGSVFSSVEAAEDLADGIKSIILAACDARGDCNQNDIPDDCDLAAMTSQDCDLSGRPDECEADCNGNGLHDSCDIAAMTSADENVNAIPDECEGITLTLDGTELGWTSVAGALGYDVVQGDLDVLRSSGGNFTTATDGCAVNDHPDTSLDDGADPAAGEGLWYLVRGLLGTGSLTYDTFGAGQVEVRDAEIDASGVSCP